MRIESITIEGTIEGTNALPRAFVRIARRRGDDFCYAEILRPNEVDRRMVIPVGGSHDDVYERQLAAVEIEAILHGTPGTDSDIHKVLRAIETFAD